MIYFLNYQYCPNIASENRLQGYYRALDGLGVRTTVVYVHPNKNYDKVKGSYTNIRFVYLWNSIMLYRGFFRNLTLNRYLKKFVEQLKPGDIVYTYNVSIITKMCEEVDGIKVFAERTEHPGASTGFPCPQLALPPEALRNTLQKLSGLFVISQTLKDYYESVGVDSSKIHIINMTVDIERFKEIQKEKTEKYIAYCGTASNNKDGVDQLIKAFALVIEHHPMYKLYIIGNAPSKNQQFDNLNLVKSLGIEDKVVFTGLVPSERMPQLLKNAEILALARPDNLQAKFGFPTKLGEYLLTANPVVVTSVGEIPLFLKDGVSALLVEPDDPKLFAEKLNWVIENPEKAKKIGKTGKTIAEKCFNSETETQKLLSIMKTST